MRRFHSYGPVDQDIHFWVPRVKLVKDSLNHIIGETGKGRHYFTIWGPRQTGKTWLMQQVRQRRWFIRCLKPPTANRGWSAGSGIC